MTRLVAALAVTAALLLSALVMLLIPPSHEVLNEIVAPVGQLALTPHAPIHIDGNPGFTNASGVVWGSGSESDPYIISDWDINASSSRGIYVENTDAHFVIRTCYVHDGEANANNGVHLENSSHGTVRDSFSVNNWYGIFLVNSSSDNTIVNNTCSYNRYDGIELYSLCDRNIIINNTFVDNLDGIHLESSRHNIVDGNVMVNNGVTMIGYVVSDCTTNEIGPSNTVNGKPVCYYRNQSGVTVPEGAGEIVLANCTGFIVENQTLDYAHVGIEVVFSSNITIRGNTCTNNSYGILLWFSHNNTLNRNTIHNNHVNPDNWWFGIGLDYSSSNAICDNVISDCIYGLSLMSSSDNNAVSNNRCSNNSYGVYFMESDHNEMSDNRIDNNTYYGALMLASVGNVIWNNSFIDNNGATSAYSAAHVQAYDVGPVNSWNSTRGFGNYWSDWTTPDANGDGIVDSPYVIGGIPGVRDYYPLTNAPVLPIPEFSLMQFVVVAFLALAILTRKALRRKALTR